MTTPLDYAALVAIAELAVAGGRRSGTDNAKLRAAARQT